MRIVYVMLGVFITMAVAAAARVPVGMIDFAFSPDSVTIAAGDEVVWTNSGTFLHTSTSGVNGVPDGTWNSGDVAPGDSYARVFSTSGTFHYFCMHHYLIGMVGVVVVGTSGVDDSRVRSDRQPGIRAWPNPFHSTVRLEFNATTGTSPVVRIYDVLGHLVSSLALTRGDGCCTANWDGRDEGGRVLPAGVYHCVSGSERLVLGKLD
jgi:plastocyanin